MQIRRNSSRLNFNRRRQRSGCWSMAVFLGVLVSITSISWNWLGQRFNNPSSVRSAANLQPAHEAFARGDLDGAIKLAQDFLALQDDDTASLTLLVRALVLRSYTDYNRGVDRASALALTTGFLNRAPRNTEVLAIHAYALQVNGQPVEAARVAERALLQNPESIPARIALGLAYGGVGSFGIALRESQQAVQTAARHDASWLVESQRAVAISYSDLGDYTNAIGAIERAITINPRLISLYFERALYALPQSA